MWLIHLYVVLQFLRWTVGKDTSVTTRAPGSKSDWANNFGANLAHPKNGQKFWANENWTLNFNMTISPEPPESKCVTFGVCLRVIQRRFKRREGFRRRARVCERRARVRRVDLGGMLARSYDRRNQPSHQTDHYVTHQTRVTVSVSCPLHPHDPLGTCHGGGYTAVTCRLHHVDPPGTCS